MAQNVVIKEVKIRFNWQLKLFKTLSIIGKISCSKRWYEITNDQIYVWAKHNH